MEKILNFYRGLTPQTRFRLIFFVLASLIWVPVRITRVEVYEPYRYDPSPVAWTRQTKGILSFS